MEKSAAELYAECKKRFSESSIPAQGIPDGAQPENVMALKEVVDEYGAL